RTNGPTSERVSRCIQQRSAAEDFRPLPLRQRPHWCIRRNVSHGFRAMARRPGHERNVFLWIQGHLAPLHEIFRTRIPRAAELFAFPRSGSHYDFSALIRCVGLFFTIRLPRVHHSSKACRRRIEKTFADWNSTYSAHQFTPWHGVALVCEYVSCGQDTACPSVRFVLVSDSLFNRHNTGLLTSS